MGEGLKSYADSLAKIVRNNHHYLTKAIDDFQEKCRMVTLERNIPRDVVVEIRRAYKEILNKLRETKAIQQVLQGKCRQFYRRDPIRDKQITEFGFIAKNGYSKFQYTLMQVEAKNKLALEETTVSKKSAESNPPMDSAQGEPGGEVHLKPGAEEESEATEVLTDSSRGGTIDGPVEDSFLYGDCFDTFTADHPSENAIKLLTKELMLLL
jgi:hypothetical protein